MIRNVLAGLIVTVLAVSMSGTADARRTKTGVQVFALSGSAVVIGEGERARDAAVPFEWKAELKIGQLVGSPVISLRLMYDFRAPLHGGRVTIPVYTVNGTKYDTIPLWSLSERQRNMLDVWDIRLRVWFTAPGINQFAIEEHVGYLPGRKKWSFNVPSGMNWNRVFFRNGASRKDYLSKTEAIEAFRRELRVHKVEFVTAKLSVTDFHHWWMTVYRKPELDGKLASLTRLAKDLNFYTGLDAMEFARSIRLRAFDFPTPEKIAALIKETDVLYSRLRRLPGRFHAKRKDANKMWDAAIANSEVHYDAAKRMVGYWSKDRDGYHRAERGRPPKFDLQASRVVKRVKTSGSKSGGGQTCYIEMSTKICNKSGRRRKSGAPFSVLFVHKHFNKPVTLDRCGHDRIPNYRDPTITFNFIPGVDSAPKNMKFLSKALLKRDIDRLMQAAIEFRKQATRRYCAPKSKWDKLTTIVYIYDDAKKFNKAREAIRSDRAINEWGTLPVNFDVQVPNR